MAGLGGRFLSSFLCLPKLSVEPSVCNGLILQTRNYALRKATRERFLKKKLRNIAAKKAKEAKMPKKKISGGVLPDAMRYPEKELKISPDNVWLEKRYSWKIFSFEEALQSHRDVFHSTVYNVPKAPIKAFIEIDLKNAGKKLVGSFSSLVSIPHKFSLEDHRSVLAFAKTPEQQQEAREAGATLVVGSDAIRLIRIGDMTISDFESVIAHPSILSEILCIKGIMKSKFPTLKRGTLGSDLKTMVYTQLYGIKYHCSPNLHYPEFGTSEITFGTIDMSTEQLRENLNVLVASVQSHKPKRPGPFITRIRLKCPPNHEILKIDLTEFIQPEEVIDDDDSDDDTVALAEN